MLDSSQSSSNFTTFNICFASLLLRPVWTCCRQVTNWGLELEMKMRKGKIIKTKKKYIKLRARSNNNDRARIKNIAPSHSSLHLAESPKLSLSFRRVASILRRFVCAAVVGVGRGVMDRECVWWFFIISPFCSTSFFLPSRENVLKSAHQNATWSWLGNRLICHSRAWDDILWLMDIWHEIVDFSALCICPRGRLRVRNNGN